MQPDYASLRGRLLAGGGDALLDHGVFCETLETDLLVSQLASERALAAYRERLGCRAISLPNTGLDAERFRPLTPLNERAIVPDALQMIGSTVL